jgi:hypothetical protein
VLKQASPTQVAAAPKARPRKIVPSAKAIIPVFSFGILAEEQKEKSQPCKLLKRLTARVLQKNKKTALEAQRGRIKKSRYN